METSYCGQLYANEGSLCQHGHWDLEIELKSHKALCLIYGIKIIYRPHAMLTSRVHLKFMWKSQAKFLHKCLIGSNSFTQNQLILFISLLHCSPIIWLILSVCFYRSESGFQLLVCSWDGTIAYADFTTEELGRPMSEEEKV